MSTSTFHSKFSLSLPSSEPKDVELRDRITLSVLQKYLSSDSEVVPLRREQNRKTYRVCRAEDSLRRVVVHGTGSDSKE